MKPPRRVLNRNPEIPVASFVDLAFLLNIFFIMVTSFSEFTGVVADVPAAVLINASEIPPATAPGLIAPAAAMPENALIMPVTVPAMPSNGATLPMVASR